MGDTLSFKYSLWDASNLAFRHPHPILYWIAFLGVALAILMPGLAEYRDLPPETGFLLGFARVATPVVIGAFLFCFAMGLLGWGIHRFAEFRPGNRVRITRGDHAGTYGVVDPSTDRRPAAPLSVRLDADDSVVQISRYDAEKRGLRSSFF